MFTATIHGFGRAGERGQLGRSARLGVQDDEGHPPGRLAQQLGDPAGVLGVGGDHQPGGVTVALGRIARSRASASARIRGRPSGRSVEIAVR